MFFGYQTSTRDPGAGPHFWERPWFWESLGIFKHKWVSLAVSHFCTLPCRQWDVLKKSGRARYICHLSQSLCHCFSIANSCSPFLCEFRDNGSCNVSSLLEDVQLLKPCGKYSKPILRNSLTQLQQESGLKWTENWHLSLSKYLEVLIYQENNLDASLAMKS